jgi:hypothetical protein
LQRFTIPFRILRVYPGKSGRSGDCFEKLQESVARTTGNLTLTVIKADTGRYITLPPIPLGVLYAQAPAAQARVGTVQIQGPISHSKFEPTPEKRITLEMREAVPRKTDVVKKDRSPVDARKDVPTAADVGESASVLRSFPWPPPKASSWMTLKPELLREPGKVASLRDVSRRIEAAFRRAGYIEWSYYAVPKGFAIVSQLEQYQPDGTPLKEPDRWSIKVSAPRVFSLDSYIKALFTANQGRFRIVALIVTSNPVTQESKTKITREEALKWVGEGANKLPKEYERIPFGDDVDCTALIYEFEQASRDAKPKFQDPGLLSAPTHLAKARLLEGLSQ